MDVKQNDAMRHMDARFDQLEKLIKSGFPHGDPDAHRRVHETFISEAAERAALKKSIIEKIVTGGVWSVIVLVALAVWEYLKTGVHKP